MKKCLTVLSVLLCSAVCSAQFAAPYSDLNDSDGVKALKEHVGFLSAAALEGRAAGSEGEQEAARYFTQVLERYGVDVLSGRDGELFGLRQERGDTLRSRNVVGYIPGYDHSLKDHYIVIGARLDNLGIRSVNVDGEPVQQVFYGANGNASGLALLLELAGKLSSGSFMLRRSVIIAAFGSSLESGAGSWYFVNRSFPGIDKVDAMVNLDMVGTLSRGFYAYTASNADLNALIDEVGHTLQPVKPTVVSLEPVNSDHRQFYSKQIPAVLFTTGMYPEYNSTKDTASILEYDSMEREAEYLYNFVVALAGAPAPEFRPSDAQKKSYSKDPEVVQYYNCDVPPTFLGSSDPRHFLRKWVYTYLRYPKSAMQEGVQGQVLVDFIIDENGKVRDAKVVRGGDARLEEEALRVISASPDWKPGKVGGRKVRSEMSLYVDFKLEKRKK